MATELFSEALHRLKEIHEKEVLGMQAKLTELTMEKCRDAQRIEELFSKNHILREQHKVLNENIKVLENRLRAGLCDRCTVTQELAKKKQQEYESCHFHSLQQISSLTNEINLLKEENKALLDELRKFKCLEMERSRSRSHTPENNPTPEVHHSAPPNANQRVSPEKTSKDGESQEHISDHHVSEDTSAAVLKLSPVVKSLQTMGNDNRQVDMTMSGVQKVLLSNHNQQRISNQLHGTIAVMRAGAKSGHLMTPPPIHKRSSCSDGHTNEGRTELYDAPSPLDSLKHVIPEEQFILLRQHFAQKRLRSPGVPTDLPMRYLLAKNRESAMERKRSDDDWEEKAAMADLQGAVLYVRDQEYKNRINPTNQREKIHYLLNKQNQGLRLPTSPGDVPKCHMRESTEEKELSLIQVLSARWKNNKNLTNQREEQDWAEKDTKPAEPEKRSHYEEDATPDKPLDLSDTRRGQNSKREHTCLYETHMASPASRHNCSPPTRASGSDHIHGTTTEDPISLALNEHERHSGEDTRDIDMEHSGDLEMARESLPATRAAKGHKRHRDSEPDEEEPRGVLDNSPHRDMEEEPDTSDSEMEGSQHTQADASRDSYKNHDPGRWKKKLPQASKKSMRKKRKDPDHTAESNSSEDNDV